MSSLPQVKGWLIDFRTARAIFLSQSNERIDHCVGMCHAGALLICHCEETMFKGVVSLQSAFLGNPSCVYEPDEALMMRCENISNLANGKPRLPGNETAIFLTAIAAERSFGVISDHRSASFTTVYDLCNHFGIPIFSADEYFELL